MSSLNTSTADVNAVKFITTTFTKSWSYSLICLGIIGHSLSIYIFTRSTLRSNSCVCYFLASTISGIFVTCINTPVRLLQSGYFIDLFTYSDTSCKILTFIVMWAKAQTSWYIALASVDRFFCSSRSVAMRKWSNVRTARWTILLFTIAVSLAYIYVFVQYQVSVANHKCNTLNSTVASFNGIWNLIVFSMGPAVVMLIFGSLTIRHLRQTVKRVIPRNTQHEPVQEQSQHQKTTDRQLIRMMIVQCIYFSITSIPVSIFLVYIAARPPVIFTTLQLAKDDLFAQTTGTVSITGACTSFYLFTLSSPLFRRELMHLFRCHHGRQ